MEQNKKFELDDELLTEVAGGSGAEGLAHGDSAFYTGNQGCPLCGAQPPMEVVIDHIFHEIGGDVVYARRCCCEHYLLFSDDGFFFARM